MQRGGDKVFHFKKDKFSKDIILKHLKEYLNIFLPSHPSFIFALHLAWWGFSDIKNYSYLNTSIKELTKNTEPEVFKLAPQVKKTGKD